MAVLIVLMYKPGVFRLSFISGSSVRAGSGPSIAINDTVEDAVIFAVDDNGDVVDELDGVVMVF